MAKRISYLNPYSALAVLFVLAVLFALGACAPQPKVDLATYSPIIDTQNINQEKLAKDLTACRKLGQNAQAIYKKRRDEQIAAAELEAFFKTAIIGGLIGAATGDSTSAAKGAVIGGVLGASEAGNSVEYTRTFVEFGPAAIIDRCMVGRGYKLLNKEGFGGA